MKGSRCGLRRNSFKITSGEIMKLLHDLFFTDYGLMSLIGLVFMLGMGVFFLRLFLSGAQTRP
jgi:hypothetical protein